MIIEVFKDYTDVSLGSKSEYLKVLGYSFKIKTDNLLLFIRDLMGLDDKSEVPMYKIHKVQYIASCKTILDDEILVAFYIGDYGSLYGFVISELPNGLRSLNGNLIDYKSYTDICDLTGEAKLSLIEYFHKVAIADATPNSYLNYNDLYLNSDQSEKLFK